MPNRGVMKLHGLLQVINQGGVCGLIDEDQNVSSNVMFFFSQTLFCAVVSIIEARVAMNALQCVTGSLHEHACTGNTNFMNMHV